MNTLIEPQVAPRVARPALPDTIENPVIGDRVTFLKTARDTGGEFVLVEITLMPRAIGSKAHVHTTFTERFEVIEGRLGVILGDPKSPVILGPGEKAEVPPGMVHGFFNPTDETVRFRVEVSPAGQFENLLRVAYGLARDGRTTKKGVPNNIWEFALLFEMSESYPAGIPPVLLQKVARVLGWIARRLGYDPTFPQYTQKEPAGLSA